MDYLMNYIRCAIWLCTVSGQLIFFLIISVMVNLQNMVRISHHLLHIFHLQGQDLNEVTINLRSIQGSEGAAGPSSKPQEQIEPRPSTDQQYDHITSNPNPEVGSNSNVLPDEVKRKF